MYGDARVLYKICLNIDICVLEHSIYNNICYIARKINITARHSLIAWSAIRFQKVEMTLSGKTL